MDGKLRRARYWNGRCEECDGSFQMVVVLDSIWQRIAPSDPEIVLCLQCMDKRLGREITLEDLKPCGWTDAICLLDDSPRGLREIAERLWNRTPNPQWVAERLIYDNHMEMT